jgi:PAS domain S-box-containing protein
MKNEMKKVKAMKSISLNESGQLSWIHWFIIFSSLVVTVFAWDVSNTKSKEKLQLRFELKAQQIVDLVTERMEHYEDSLRSGVALFHSQDNNVDYKTWRKFSKALDIENKYLGILGIGVIYYVIPEKKNQFLLNEKKQRSHFKIHPVHNRNEFWPITYIEPIQNNVKALGLDMAFELNRLTAAKKSRDPGTPQITAPITLVQDSKKTPGFLKFLPIYSKPNLKTVEDRRKYFIGHVYAPFIMNGLIEGVLNQDSRKLNFSITDENDILINELQKNMDDIDPNPMYSKEVTVDMYGRPWLFKINTGLGFRESADNYQSTLILVGGIIIDSLLFMIFFVLSKSNKKALILTKEVTRKLTLSDEYYRHVIESAPCGIMIIDGAGNIERVNPEVCKLFSYTESELIGMPIENLVPHEKRKNHHELRKNSNITSTPIIMGGRDVMGLAKLDVQFPVEIGLASVDIEGEQKIIATIVDMTAHSNTLNELKRSNKELDDFAYVASHDLKAPLRGIIQLSNWIKEDIETLENEETKTNLDLLQSRTIRLEKLLDDLLSYSRIGRDLGGVDEIDIGEFLHGIFSLLDPPSGIKLKIEDGMPTFQTMRVPLEVIFRNLIGNAIKHHDKPEGLITISVIDKPSSYQFTVEDDGPGIESQHHNQVFDLFKTLKPRDEVEGSGMGLSLIKKMLSYYGEDIALISDGKSGTKFVFDWPKDMKKR